MLPVWSSRSHWRAGVSLNRVTGKQHPLHFEFIHRLIGYLMLSLTVVIYYFTAPETNYQIYLPFAFLGILLVSRRLERWLKYRFDYKIKRNILFLLDVIVVATTLAAVHLSLTLTFLAIFGLVYTSINNKISFLMASVAALLSIIIFYFHSLFVFGTLQYFEVTSPELTVIGLLCLIIFINLGNYYQNQHIQKLDQQRLYYFEQMNRYIEFANQLSRYAPLQLCQQIMNGEVEAKIEYKRKKMTIFFSDIQGFTELSETLIPDDLAFLLNEYLSHMTDIAKQYGPTVDKFMGDAILIFFGDPDSQGVEQDAKTCIEMAIAMRQQMKLLRERWKKMGYPALHIRMGISTGYCHVGNYGAAHRMAYTIVGRDANLAARLQYAAEIDEILIADETYKLIRSEFLCIPKTPIYLKGFQEPVRTWQVMEKFSVHRLEHQQWFDYEYKGFHLILNLEEVENFEYSELVEVLEQMIERIRTQQKLTNSHGVAKLNLADEIKPVEQEHVNTSNRKNFNDMKVDQF